MIGWRLIDKRFAHEAFSGEGASIFGARWNSVGIPVVYVSAHLSLAVLELLAQIKTQEDFVHRFDSFPVEIPDTTVNQVHVEDLPKDWREPVKLTTKPSKTQLIGDEWFKTKKSAVLQVPSAIVPQEFNLILNPSHPDFFRLRIGTPVPFSFDTRLWK
jgi:RES domain-containing protein